MVQECLEAQMPELPKGLKTSTPKRYIGSAKLEDFENWLSEFLGWLQLSCLTGDNMNYPQLIALGTVLGETAAEWYNREIRDPDRSRQHWDLESAIIALHNRFLHKATVQHATKKFAATRYDATQGVAGFYNELQTYASRMVVPPDEYTFKQKFLKGLPLEVVRPMMQSHHITAEWSTVSEILNAAIAVQESNEFLRSHHGSVTTQSASSSQYKRSTSGTKYPDRSAQTSRPQSSTSRPAFKSTRFTPNGRRQDSQKKPTDGRSSIPFAVSQRDSTTASSSRPTGDKRPDNSTVECYSCHQRGHYASDPKCPRYGKGSTTQRVYAVETEEPNGSSPTSREEEDPNDVGYVTVNMTDAIDNESDRDDEEEEAAPEETADNLEGSQYDSDEQPQEYEQYSEYDDHEPVAYLMGMTLGGPTPDQKELDKQAQMAREAEELRELAAEIERRHQYVRDRERSIQNTGRVPRSPTSWMWDRNMGIIHRSRCGVCLQYVTHRSEAIRQNNDEYAIAENHAQDPTNDAVARAYNNGLGTAASAIALMLHVHTSEHRDDETRAEALESARSRINEIPRRVEGNASIRRQNLAVPPTVDAATNTVAVDDLARSPMEDATESDIDEREIPALESSDDDGDVTSNAVINAQPTEVEQLYATTAPALALDRAYRTAARRPYEVGVRPVRSAEAQMCLVAYTTINGIKALTLFDTGSTTDIVSPDFARVAKLKTFELEKPVPLQLGCIGSRSAINFGLQPKISFASIDSEWYFDVANIDRYDVIIGTPFMSQYQLCLDFKTRSIIIDGNPIPSLKRGEEPRLNQPRSRKIEGKPPARRQE